jgi:hypothetical protein
MIFPSITEVEGRGKRVGRTGNKGRVIEGANTTKYIISCMKCHNDGPYLFGMELGFELGLTLATQVPYHLSHSSKL